MIGTDRRMSEPPLCPPRRATRPNREWGYSTTRCHMLGRECAEAVLPDRALYLPTFTLFRPSLSPQSRVWPRPRLKSTFHLILNNKQTPGQVERATCAVVHILFIIFILVSRCKRRNIGF